MTLELGLQIVQTLAVVIGGFFAVVQLRQMRIQRELEVGAEMVRTMQSPMMASTTLLIVDLPDNLTTAELKAKAGEKFADVVYMASVFESMGPLVARGQLQLDYYADFYRGATILCWRKLQRYTQEQRAAGYTNLFEWFEWLAQRLEERAPYAGDVPAQIQFKDWRSPSDYARLKAKPRT